MPPLSNLVSLAAVNAHTIVAISVSTRVSHTLSFHRDSYASDLICLCKSSASCRRLVATCSMGRAAPKAHSISAGQSVSTHPHGSHGTSHPLQSCNSTPKRDRKRNNLNPLSPIGEKRPGSIAGSSQLTAVCSI